MHFEVTFKNLNSRDEIRARGQALFKKLERFLDQAADVKLIVAVEHHKAVIELVAVSRGHTFKALEEDDDMRTALDKAFHSMENQLRRAKEKRTDHHRGQAGEPEEMTDEAAL